VVEVILLLTDTTIPLPTGTAKGVLTSIFGASYTRYSSYLFYCFIAPHPQVLMEEVAVGMEAAHRLPPLAVVAAQDLRVLTPPRGVDTVGPQEGEDTVVHQVALASLIACLIWDLVLVEFNGIWPHSPSLRRTFTRNIQI